MDISIYNTLSRKIETFKPIQEGHVSMYHCGPTVYDRAHIGNLRAYVFADILRRMFEYNDYTVKQVINITDVGHLVSDGDDGEDKMTKALKREGKPISIEAMRALATGYIASFVDDLRALNIELPDELPRASDHIAEDIEIIQILLQKGSAYTTPDGIYFDTGSLPTYGKLGQVSSGDSQAEARIATNPAKRNPADFALWKSNSALGWDAPWGRGFPGWHIECSAMSRAFLGQPFDIHTGGIDHIPVHHNNEIAQSEAAYGVPLAHHWMHGAFVTVDDSKMAKSSGSFVTLDTLRDETLSPLAYRYWLLTAHYRSPVNFTREALQSSQNALVKLMSAIGNLPDGGAVDREYTQRFSALINDDLATPQAIALAWELLKDKQIADQDKRATLIDFDRVLGLNLGSIPVIGSEEQEVPEEIRALADAREDARRSRDWAKADALRHEIESRGFDISDGSDGPVISLRE